MRFDFLNTSLTADKLLQKDSIFQNGYKALSLRFGNYFAENKLLGDF